VGTSVQKNDVALYFCENCDRESSLVPLQMDLFGNITNWPKDFFGDDLADLEAMALAQATRRTSTGTGGGQCE